MLQFIKILNDVVSFAKDFKEIWPSLTKILFYLETPSIILLATGTVNIAVLLIYCNCNYKKYKKRTNFIKNDLNSLDRRGVLTSSGMEPSTGDRTWLLRRKIFWPVVPNPNISIIHVAFITCLKYLMSKGFDVYILIYDLHYKGRREKEDRIVNQHTIDNDIKKFILFLKDSGLKSGLRGNSVSYALESQAMNSRAYFNYSKVCSDITLSQLQEIGQKTGASNKKQAVLRLLKPISIIAYLTCLESGWFPSSIAVTLCGEDEKKLYKECHSAIKNLCCKGYTPFQIYMPKFNGFSPRDMPGVLSDNYTLNANNKEKLKVASEEHTTKFGDFSDPINFILTYLLFGIDDNSTHKFTCPQLTQVITKGSFIAECKDCATFNKCVIDNVFMKYST